MTSLGNDETDDDDDSCDDTVDESGDDEESGNIPSELDDVDKTSRSRF